MKRQVEPLLALRGVPRVVCSFQCALDAYFGSLFLKGVRDYEGDTCICIASVDALLGKESLSESPQLHSFRKVLAMQPWAVDVPDDWEPLPLPIDPAAMWGMLGSSSWSRFLKGLARRSV